MKAIVVANRGDADTGYVGERLRELEATLEPRYREESETFAGAEDEADLIVLMGSYWSIYREKTAAQVGAERELVRRAARRGVPVLGICFGGQMVASALGLEVERAPGGEAGWSEVESDDPALCPPGPWFELHRDRWVDAGELRSFARSALAPQALVSGRLMAVQFHPEVTPEMVSSWVRQRGALDDPADADSIEAATAQNDAAAKARCSELIDRFLADVATRPVARTTG